MVVVMHMRRLLALILTAVFAISAAGCVHDEETAESYEDLLFDPSYVHTIDITLSEEDWSDILSDPLAKTRYMADISIDGETVTNVSFATKGNASLHLVAAEGGSRRYSFKVIFDKFVEGQTWHGLDRLNLLNMFGDPSLMRDHISYLMFRKQGVPAPLSSYVMVTVNGQVQGLYLAVEDVDVSFAYRNFGGEGYLYKPENGETRIDENEDIIENGDRCIYLDENYGSDLVYRGDDAGLYPDIFENDVYRVDEGSYGRVINALRNLSDQTDLENALYTDEVISYFAVHNFLVNYDTYTGRMLHNYYLYENGGRLGMIPWDYDTIFGYFPEDGVLIHASDASRVINYGIDAPLNMVTEQERPMWGWIPSDENYLEIYHDAMDRLISSYFESGEFERETQAVYDMILPYVEQDPTAFFTVDEFNEGYEMFRNTAGLRARSIRLQLDGALATVYEEQIEEDRVDASSVIIESML